MIAYNQKACSSELRYLQQCFSQQAVTDIYIPSDVDQEQAKEKANLVSFGLSVLSPAPSPECVTVLKPFLCFYLFGLCDTNHTDGQSHQVTQADCERIRDDVCAREWAQAEMYLDGSEYDLPQCSDFPSQEKESCLSELKYYHV